MQRNDKKGLKESGEDPSPRAKDEKETNAVEATESRL